MSSKHIAIPALLKIGPGVLDQLGDYLKELELEGISSVRDLWRQKNLSTSDLRYYIPTHGVRYLKVK